MADRPNFWEDIFPLFTDGDIACMRARGVLLADINWWKDDDNCDIAIEMLDSGKMPLGGPRWHSDNIEKLKVWKAKGFPEGERPTGNEDK